MENEKYSIYTTVLQLIATNGLHFSTADISRQEKISKRKLYQLFATKDQLIEEAINFALDSITQSEQTLASAPDLSYQEKLKQGFLQTPQNYNLGILINQLPAIQAKYPQIATKVTATFDQSIELTLVFLQAGMKIGELKTVNLTLLKVLFTDAFTRIYSPNFLTEHQLTLDEALTDLFTIFFDGLAR